MSYLQQLHEERKARLQRLHSGPRREAVLVEIKEHIVSNSKIPVSKPTKPLAPTIVEVDADECEAFGLSKVVETDLSTTLKLRKILSEVAVIHNVNVDDIKSPSHVKVVAGARFEYFYRALTETTASLAVAAKAVNRDHTATMYGAATYCDKHGLPFPRGASWVGYCKRFEQVRATTARREAERKAAQ